MKRTLHTILIITTLLTLLFTACNADASAGLFRQLADAKEPVGIRYKQIIGRSIAKDTLYFLTNDGIYKTDGTTTTRIRENERGYPVHAAYFDGPNGLIFYLINNGNNAEVYQINTDGTKVPKLPPTEAEDLKLGWKLKQLLTNGLYIIKGKDTTDVDSLLVATYQSGPPADTYAKTILLNTGLSGYDVEAVLQMSGRQHWDLGPFDGTISTAPMILSFVNKSGSSFKHYYTDGTNSYEITAPDERLAGFTVIESGGSKYLYILTLNGDLFGCQIIAGDMTPILMKKSGKTFAKNTFMYAVTNGGNTYIITKPQSPNTAFWVFSFEDGLVDATKAVSMAEVKEGYAEYMNNVNIVNAYEIDTDKLLIATYENGMFSVTIDPTAANSNANSGTSTPSEAYKIDW